MEADVASSCAGKIILMMSHGYEIQGDNDPFVATVDEAMEQFAAATSASAFAANIFPPCTSSCLVYLSCPSSRRAHSDEDSGMVPRRWFPEDRYRVEEDS